MSKTSARRSTTFPLPSSPHCPPTTAMFGIIRPSARKRARDAGRALSELAPVREYSMQLRAETASRGLDGSAPEPAFAAPDALPRSHTTEGRARVLGCAAAHSEHDGDHDRWTLAHDPGRRGCGPAP